MRSGSFREPEEAKKSVNEKESWSAEHKKVPLHACGGRKNKDEDARKEVKAERHKFL